MTAEIHAEPICIFRAGQWRLMRVTNSGRYIVPLKSGDAPMSFAPGDVLIADEKDNIIAGPIDLTSAATVATKILEGDEREITNTTNLLALCAFVIDQLIRKVSQPTLPKLTPSAPTGSEGESV